MDKEYIEEQYRIAYSDYMLALNDDCRFDALRRMSKLQKLACELYGFEFCDFLGGIKE